MNRSTMSPLPPSVPPSEASATMFRTSPPNQSQNPRVARRGKAMAREPSCSGTIATHSARASGRAAPNTRPTRWASNSCEMDVVERQVAAVDALDPDDHVDDHGGQQTEQATEQEELADDLVVGRRQDHRGSHRARCRGEVVHRCRAPMHGRRTRGAPVLQFRLWSYEVGTRLSQCVADDCTGQAMTARDYLHGCRLGGNPRPVSSGRFQLAGFMWFVTDLSPLAVRSRVARTRRGSWRRTAASRT